MLRTNALVVGCEKNRHRYVNTEENQHCNKKTKKTASKYSNDE